MKVLRGDIKMFQNIQTETNNQYEGKHAEKRKLLSNIFAIKDIPLYVITLMISTIGIGQDVSIFSIAIIAAILANNIPAVGFVICGLIGNAIGFGVNGVLTYIITLLLLCLSMFILKPVYNEENRNEKIKLGKNVIISTFIVNLVQAILTTFTIYDALVTISVTIIAFVFYKIFVKARKVIHSLCFLCA